jgi:hypothetical protein
MAWERQRRGSLTAARTSRGRGHHGGACTGGHINVDADEAVIRGMGRNRGRKWGKARQRGGVRGGGSSMASWTSRGHGARQRLGTARAWQCQRGRGSHPPRGKELRLEGASVGKKVWADAIGP